MKAWLVILVALSSFALHASPVNINSADAQSIAKALTGIGKARAEAIVQYRETNGPFASADDLIKIKGVSSKIVDKNREDILLKDN